MEVDVKADFEDINGQLQQLGQQLDKVSNTRNNLIAQIQNLQGILAYLKSKLPLEEEQKVVDQKEETTDDFERSAEYPSKSESGD